MGSYRHLLAAALCASTLALPAATVAQVGLEVTTPFPAVTVDPGATATFPLTITTTVPERVDLAVSAAPEGWTTRVRGGGSTIDAVYTGALQAPAGQEPPEVTLEVDVPEDVAPDTYQVTLEARSSTLTHSLTLDLTVAQAEAGGVTLTAEFPSLRGPSDATFQFDLELENETNQETAFSLEVQAPPRWQASARPTGEEQAATAIVEAGGSERIQVEVTPPLGVAVPAQVYPILVRALGGSQPAEAQLAIEITGTPLLSLTTADQRLNARVTAGGTTTVNLVVANEGTATLTNLTFTSDPPQGWQVTFSPEAIAELPPEQTATVQATLEAASTALAGDYIVGFSASAEEASAETVEVRTAVETSPVGGFLGLGIIGLVLVGLLFVFWRYGRR